jgi:cephalosporin hydroxylase
MLLNEVLDLKVRDWIEHYQRVIVSNSIRYKGIPTWKNVMDLWVYQEIVHETQPEVIVELGCKFGGGTTWLADLMRTVGTGRVVGVDLIAPRATLPANACFFQGDSSAAAIVERVHQECRGKRTMVIADSNHSEEHVLKELRLYSPLVSVGCYFVVEDGIVDAMNWDEFTPGPRPAVHRFIAENPQFRIDHARERFAVTYNPDSFLQRMA